MNLGFRRRALLRFVALLLGAVLLGGLAWTLSQAPSEQETPGVVGVGRVDVPDVVSLAGDKAMKRLEGAGLKPGSQDQAPNGEFAEGAVFEQDPEAGTETERGTVVDLVVSTGPAQELTPSASASASPTAPVSAPAPATTATAPATATPPATAPASPTRSNAEANKRREEQRKEEQEEAAEEVRKAAQKAAKEAQKSREEATEKLEKRREEAAKELDKQLKEARKE